MKSQWAGDKVFKLVNGLLSVMGLLTFVVLPHLRSDSPIEGIAKSLLFMLCLGLCVMWPALFGTRILFKAFLKLENINPELKNLPNEAAWGVIAGLLGMVFGIVSLLLLAIKVYSWLVVVLF